MNPECPCQHCNVHLEFEAEAAGKTIVCPQCGMETVLFLPVPQQIQSPKAPVQPPKEISALDAIRMDSAYRAGRIAVSIIRVLSTIGTIIIVFSAIYDGDTGKSSDELVFAMIGGSIASLIFMLLLCGIAIAIFDMADAALKQFANSK